MPPAHAAVLLAAGRTVDSLPADFSAAIIAGKVRTPSMQAMPCLETHLASASVLQHPHAVPLMAA